MSNTDKALSSQQKAEALKDEQQKDVANKAYQKQVSAIQKQNMRIDPDKWNNANLD